MDYVVKGLSKKFENHELFSGFDITFREGSISCILGPSGCGKTTLLNIIASLQTNDNGTLLGFEKKRISYIFQEPRLLPWKTVKQNIELVIDYTLYDAEKEQIADRYIDMVQLNSFAQYYPNQLSGGMKQRVSIARAFAYKPDIILMDEPFKGLDLKLKNDLFEEFKSIWGSEKQTVIFVTHNPEEAIKLSDEIFVFSKRPVQVLEHFKTADYQNKTTQLCEKLIGLLL